MTGNAGAKDMHWETAVVVGAGMAGLLAAAALSDHFKKVVVIERDALPADPQLRRGVPQGAHVHTIMGLAVENFGKLIPGLVERLYEAGAVRIRRNYDIWFHDMAGPTPIRDVGILTPALTRPLLEHVTRQSLTQKPNVTMRDKTRFVSFVAGPGNSVAGVVVNSIAGGDETIPADLVLDCAGRGDRLPQWLAQHDYGTVQVNQLDINMGYTSAYFRPPGKYRDSASAFLLLGIPPRQRAAYITPVDGGLWISTAMGRGGDVAPPDLDGFLEWMRGLAHPVIHECLLEAELVSKFSRYNLPYGTWRRYDRLVNFPDGVLPAGEGFTSFNPMYGQGISVASAQLLGLRDALTRRAEGGIGIDGLSREYFDACYQINLQGWKAMETGDLRYPDAQGTWPADLEERWRVNAAIRRLAQVDPDVQRLSMRVAHLLEPLSALQNPQLLERAKALA